MFIFVLKTFEKSYENSAKVIEPRLTNWVIFYWMKSLIFNQTLLKIIIFLAFSRYSKILQKLLNQGLLLVTESFFDWMKSWLDV